MPGFMYSNSSVLMGNWFEDQCLEEEKLRDYLQRRERGQLWSQRRQRLESAAFARMELSLTRDGYVHFGDKIVVEHRPLKATEPPLLVSASLGSDPLLTTPHPLPDREPLMAAPACEPTVRNTFVIAGTNNNMAPTGKTLAYGEPFQLLLVAQPFRLYSARRSFVEFSRWTDHQCVLLVEEDSPYTQWRVLPVEPPLLLTKLGHPVPANVPVLLNHCFTNRHLALETNQPFTTLFGVEYEVTTHVYLNASHWPTEANHWLLRIPTVQGTMSAKPKEAKLNLQVFPLREEQQAQSAARAQQQQQQQEEVQGTLAAAYERGLSCPKEYLDCPAV